MNIDTHQLALANGIVTILDQGLMITKDVADFAESTFGVKTFTDTVMLLEEADDCSETDLLYDLIFFPNESHQIALEPILQQAIYDQTDVAPIAVFILNSKNLISLYSYDGTDSVRIRLKSKAVNLFVEKLQIAKTIAPALNQTLSKQAWQDLANPIRVKLRNMNIDLPLHWGLFLDDFLEKAAMQKPLVLKLFDFLLPLIEEMKESEDIYASLMKKKRFYFRCLQKAGQFAEKLKKNNMETLMLSGVREPCINQEEMQTGINKIDTICFLAFGKSEPLQMYEEVETINLNSESEESNLNQMLRLLS